MPIPWLVALRGMPLVSSTALLVANMYQMHAFYPWLQPTKSQEYSLCKALPQWLSSMINRSIIDLAVSFSLGVLSGALNLFIPTEGQAWYLYAASLGFTLAHLIFSKEALRQLEFAGKMEGAGQENVKALEKWLQMNMIRFLISELPAFFTALAAVTLSLEAV